MHMEFCRTVTLFVSMIQGLDAYFLHMLKLHLAYLLLKNVVTCVELLVA